MAATAALKTADAIVFVGYRFPPTDSAARRILIDAIGENDKQHIVLHTVLGPKVHDDQTERLKAMLRAVPQFVAARDAPQIVEPPERSCLVGGTPGGHVRSP